MGLGVVEIYGDAVGFEILNPTTATGISPSIQVSSGGLQAKQALITVENQPVRMRIDGTAPTATVGHIIGAGGSYVINGHQNIRNSMFINTGSGESTVNITTFE